jgi:membrane protein YdbS with pleckstrin-like domain
MLKRITKISLFIYIIVLILIVVICLIGALFYGFHSKVPDNLSFIFTLFLSFIIPIGIIALIAYREDVIDFIKDLIS